MIFTSPQALAKNTIFIYQDTGVSLESYKQITQTLKSDLPQYKIQAITATQVINTHWDQKAALFIIPGGSDLPYAKKLNHQGNARIKNYVQQGGSYLGICAGAYYGSGFVEFDKGGELEVVGKRELAFFPGKAIGPILAKYDYRNNSGARVAKLDLYNFKHASVYFNGGGYFEQAKTNKKIHIIANYAGFNQSKAAIIEIHQGLGKVILSGVHFEYNPLSLDSKDPYLPEIIKTLRSSTKQRTNLTKEIFNRLLSIT